MGADPNGKDIVLQENVIGEGEGIDFTIAPIVSLYATAGAKLYISVNDN